VKNGLFDKEQITDLDARYRQRDSLPVRKISHLAGLIPAGPLRCLDIGSGTGEWLEYLSGDVARECVGVEPGDDGYDFLRRRFLGKKNVVVHHGFLGELSETALAGKTFDIITMLDVLEHSPTPSSMLRTAYGHLREGGLLLCTTPNWYDMIWSRVVSRNSGHMTFHSSLGWASLVAKSGFYVQEVRTLKFPLVDSEWLAKHLHPFGMCVLVVAMRTGGGIP